jgi:hypothetical protein
MHIYRDSACVLSTKLYIMCIISYISLEKIRLCEIYFVESNFDTVKLLMIPRRWICVTNKTIHMKIDEFCIYIYIYSGDKELNELQKMTFHFQNSPHAILLNKSFWLDFFTTWEANMSNLKLIFCYQHI